LRSLLDVNVLIALLQPDHAHHGVAHEWWSTQRSEGWALCPLTQNGFVRIVSQPRYPKPLPITRGTDHAFWPDDISLLDAGRINRARILGPKQLTDVYLLALAVKNGGRLATFDRAIPISAVRGATKRNVVVI
jgi:uncharacterized protein